MSFISRYMKLIIRITLFTCVVISIACKKKSASDSPPVSPPVSHMNLVSKELNDNIFSTASAQVPGIKAVIKLGFDDKLDRNTVGEAVSWDVTISSADVSSRNIPVTIDYADGDSVLIIQPADPLPSLTRFAVSVSNALRSVSGNALSGTFSLAVRTGINPSNKFPVISDSALLDTVQERTFSYFWDYGHPVSGLARDKSNTSELDDCSVGGTGFGILCIPIAINRGFITRAEGLARLQKIVDFLGTKAQTYHGTFPHRINGTTGATIMWESKDNGGDIVETSFLMMGLLTARQYFNRTDAQETTLRNAIDSLYDHVDWTWFEKDGKNALYWLWSPDYRWDASFMVRGWNEALIVYVLAASSPTHPITKEVYDNGWADNGAIRNGQQYYGITLPLGPAFGGPLFTAQYSFLCINPDGLSDTYADYEVQTKNQTLINRAYCTDNPKHYFGYSDSCWGLSACSTDQGYIACSPANDVGVIAPTAALSSFAFTPEASMEALKYFYYRLGDYVWGDYGFVDAFNLNKTPVWTGPQELVYNQLPIMIAIENYRTGLIWNLFTSCPEVKAGMRKLGFKAPYL